MIASAFRDSSLVSGDGLVQVLRGNRQGMALAPRTEPVDDADAILSLRPLPGATCANQSGDSLSMSIDVRVFRADGRTLIFKKTFGGGLKGLHVRSAANPSQYSSTYEQMEKSHADSIYRSVLEALLKAI